MKVRADSDVRALRRLLSGGPAVSVYFNLSARPEEPEVTARWGAVLHDLDRLGIASTARESLTRRVLGTPPVPAVLAAFVADGDAEPTMFEMAGARQPDLVVHATLPHVLPLLVWLQEQPPYVLALVGHGGAEIEIHPGGTGETVVRTVTGPADGDGEASGRGHRTRGRRPHDAQDSWERNGSCVAGVLADELIGGQTPLLLLAGDLRVLRHVDQALPGSLRRQVSVRYVPGGRGQDGTWHRRELNVEQQLRSWATEQNRNLLRRIAEGRNANGWVAEGAAATLEALSRGRVRVLAVVGDSRDGRTAWFVAGSAEASLNGEASLARTGSEPLRRAALVDVALRTAVLAGADITILAPGTPDAPADGIGALCRFGG